MGNLNKSKETTPTTTTALKVPRGPFSTRTKILPFGPHFIKFSKTFSYEVNLAAQSSHLDELLLSKKRGYFSFCVIMVSKMVEFHPYSISS